VLAYLHAYRAFAAATGRAEELAAAVAAAQVLKGWR
jgi:hypothetical protein